MKSSPFDTISFKQSLIDADMLDKQADALTQAFANAINESNENLLAQIKRQYRLDDGVTKHDLRLFEMKQDDAFNQFKHDLKMQENQAKIEKSKREIELMKVCFIGFYGLSIGFFIGLLF